jgi:hypothetical protein
MLRRIFLTLEGGSDRGLEENYIVRNFIMYIPL